MKNIIILGLILSSVRTFATPVTVKVTSPVDNIEVTFLEAADEATRSYVQYKATNPTCLKLEKSPMGIPSPIRRTQYKAVTSLGDTVEFDTDGESLFCRYRVKSLSIFISQSNEGRSRLEIEHDPKASNSVDIYCIESKNDEHFGCSLDKNEQQKYFGSPKISLNINSENVSIRVHRLGVVK